jgi:hypothetical protein
MSSMRSFQANGWRIAACIGLLAMSLIIGCGRKLPPIQPGALPPPVVVDLAYEVQGSAVLLSWSVPAFEPSKESAVARFKVLRARQSAKEAECRTCPPAFKVIADMAASAKASGSRMRFRDALEPGFINSYKLQSYANDGIAVKESNAVTVTP